jgi:hypothetical protein
MERACHQAGFEPRVENQEPWQRYAGFVETGKSGTAQTVEFSADEMRRSVGDIVLARRDMGTSYHLSVVLDDAAQGITHVVRGQDLFEATKIHVVLQRLLGLPTPVYRHCTLSLRRRHTRRYSCNGRALGAALNPATSATAWA